MSSWHIGALRERWATNDSSPRTDRQAQERIAVAGDLSDNGLIASYTLPNDRLI